MKRLLAVGEGGGAKPFPTANQPFHTQLLYICDGIMLPKSRARHPKEPPNTSFEIQMKLFLSVGGRACTTCPCPTVKNISFVHEVLVLGVPFGFARARAKKKPQMKHEMKV